MSAAFTYALTVAGFDPSGGAGILADIKTFEQNNVYGLAVNTGNTIQTEDRFYSMRWSDTSEMLETLRVLLDSYPVTAMKTGIMPSMDVLLNVILCAKSKQPGMKIIADPIVRSSTHFDFMAPAEKEKMNEVWKHCFLITPNVPEAIALTGLQDAHAAAAELSKHCAVLLKGGHQKDTPGVDYLYEGDTCTVLKPGSGQTYAKHGSGCVLSSAITANIAKGYDLIDACTHAKQYTEHFLQSHHSLLGLHHV